MRALGKGLGGFRLCNWLPLLGSFVRDALPAGAESGPCVVHPIGSNVDAVPDPGGLETTAELTVASSVGPYLMGPSSLHLDLVGCWKPPGVKTCRVSV